MPKKIQILTKKEIKEALVDLPGWKYAKNKLNKEFEFDDFLGSFNFIKKLVPFFQKNDHHPDIQIKYSKVLFELQRFDVGGKVTDKDVTVAKKIQKLYTTHRKNT